MGWNQGYTIFEATVVGAYDLGKLDKALLSVLMEPYRGSDIDSGGEQGLRSKDGLDVVEIVVKTWGTEIPARPELPNDYRKWTPEQDRADEAYYEARYEAFRAIKKEFDWL
jgi:hypothetical protein